MLTKNQNPQISYFARLLALPILVTTILAFTLRTKTAITPTIKLEKQVTVVIDAGHGIMPNGKPNGAAVDDVNEDAIVLAISKKIQERNRNKDLKIVLTRTSSNVIELHHRVEIAKENKADLFVSLHMAAMPQNPKAGTTSDKSLTNGFGIYVSNKQPLYQQQSELLGSVLREELNSIYPTNPYLLKRNIGIWVLDQNVCPSVLVECGFLTDEKDREFITKDNNQNAVAERILRAIERFALNQKTNANNLQPKFPGDTAIIQTDNYNGDKYYAVRINGVLQELLINDTPVPKDQLTKYEPTVDKIKQMLLLRKEKASHNYKQDIQENKRPLYIVNGKEYSGSLDDISVNDIESITVLKGDSAKNKYGDKGQYGIIEIRLKKQIIHPDVTFHQSGSDVSVTKMNGNPSINESYNVFKPVSNRLIDTVPKNERLFTKVEKEPTVDKNEWSAFLRKGLQSFIEDAGSNGINAGTYVVKVRFIVSKDGTLSDFTALNDPGYGMAEKVVAMMKDSPRWKPGMQNGKPVNAYHTQPITFVVQDSN